MNGLSIELRWRKPLNDAERSSILWNLNLDICVDFAHAYPLCINWVVNRRLNIWPHSPGNDEKLILSIRTRFGIISTDSWNLNTVMYSIFFILLHPPFFVWTMLVFVFMARKHQQPMCCWCFYLACCIFDLKHLFKLIWMI